MPPRAEHCLTVLVADDDELIRFAVRVALESAGYQVIEAGSGAEVVLAVKRQRVYAVILDAHMPGWSLVETLDALNPSVESHGPGVIVVSGAPVELGHRAPYVQSILRKPVGLETLTTAVRAVSGNQNAVYSGTIC